MTMYEKKAEFVENELKAVLIKVDKNIAEVDYSRNEYHEEYVTISYKHNRYLKVCVTGNSLLAIVKDVMKKLEY